MLVQCIACEGFTFEKVGGEPSKMAKAGAGRCRHEKRNYVYTTALFERECDKFDARDPELTARFIQWLKKQ